MSTGGGFLTAFQILAIVLATFNEVLIPFSQWIISPSRPTDRALGDIYPSAITTALVYAIAEPLVHKAITLISIPPTFVIGMLAQLFAFVIPLCRDKIHIQQLLYKIAQQPIANGNVCSDSTEKGVIQIRPDFKDLPPRPSRVQMYYALLGPIVMTATLNAAFLLFQQVLAATSPAKVNALPGLLVIWGTVLFGYIATFFFSIAKDSHRARFIGVAGLDVLPVQLFSLALLLTSRAATRQLLGINPLFGFGSADQVLTNNLIERESYSAFAAFYGSRPSWYMPGSTVTGWIAIVALFWLQGQARRNTEEKYEEYTSLVAKVDTSNYCGFEDPSK